MQTPCSALHPRRVGVSDLLYTGSSSGDPVFFYAIRLNVYIDLNVNVCKYACMIDTKRIPFTTTLNKDLIKKLKLLAVERETAVNVLIEEAVNQYLEKPTKKPK